MTVKTVKLPQDAIIQMLKALPEDVLRDIFWKAFTEVDNSPLTEEEKARLATAETEFERGETVNWNDLQ